MALPVHYEIGDYFKCCLELFEEFQWIFKARNTHILVDGVLGEIPKDWVRFFHQILLDDLHGLAEGRYLEGAPPSLNEFISRINSLKPSQKPIKSNLHSPRSKPGLNKKKQHEISMLAPIIDEICRKTQCDLIIDIGSGLGYLPELLSEEFNYTIIGLESDQTKVETAKKNKKSLNIEYIQMFVNEESIGEICKIIKKYKKDRVCLTGLHACADLSVTMMNLFDKCEFAKALVIMPCCYHRLQFDSEKFTNFPLSEKLKYLVQDKSAERFLQVSFLRLACQGTLNFTKMTANEHEKHAQNCLFRAILQEVADEAGQQVSRLKRKSRCKQSISQSLDPFEAYLTNLQATHTLIGTLSMSNDVFLQKMREKWSIHQTTSLHLIQALTGLQVYVQSLAENMILLDRIVYLNERGIEGSCVKVTDEGLSPRCHALLATKPQQ